MFLRTSFGYFANSSRTMATVCVLHRSGAKLVDDLLPIAAAARVCQSAEGAG